MEMTGLDATKEGTIEIAAIVTDLSLNPLGQFESVVFQEQSLLNKMDEWNTNQHTKSGLLAKVSGAPKVDTVDLKLAEFIKSHFKDEKAIIAGNSIPQDRLFIRKEFHKTEALLHYRMLDVTSWKIILEPMGHVFEKKGAHTALSDILESIEEFKFYLGKLKTLP